MIVPGAIWEPVAYKGLHKRTRKTAAILHTNGSGHTGSTDEDLFNWWTLVAAGKTANGPTIGAQFQVARDGTVYQYVDTDLVVYHAFSGSEFAVGIETEDDGDPSKPWTPAQMDGILLVLRALKVPSKLLLPTASDGLGWHRQYTVWNQNGHVCPGSVREGQINDILSALKEDSEMTLQDLLDFFGYKTAGGNDLGDLIEAGISYLKNTPPADAERKKIYDGLVAKFGAPR